MVISLKLMHYMTKPYFSLVVVPKCKFCSRSYSNSRKAYSLSSSITTIASERVFTQEDIAKFADLSGDYNPIHTTKNTTSKYTKPIVHGTLILG